MIRKCLEKVNNVSYSHNVRNPSHYGLLLLWLAFPLLPTWATLLAGAGLIWWKWQVPAIRQAAILPMLIVALGEVPTLQHMWPLPLVLALGLMQAIPALRFPLNRGRIGNWWAILALALLTAVALPSWLWLTQPDILNLAGQIPDWPIALLVLLAILFSISNAIAEELAWRQVLWDGLQNFPIVGIILFQALCFGMAHINGFPRGLIGVALAASYGALLGWLRHRTQGLLAPVIAHVAADLTIAVCLWIWF